MGVIIDVNAIVSGALAAKVLSVEEINAIHDIAEEVILKGLDREIGDYDHLSMVRESVKERVKTSRENTIAVKELWDQYNEQ